MKAKAGFVPELKLPLAERLRDALISRGLAVDQYGWLAEAFLKAGCVPDDEDAFPTMHQLLTSAFNQWKRFEDRDGTLLAVLETMDGHGRWGVTLYQPSSARVQWKITAEARATFIAECTANGIDFTKALLSNPGFAPSLSDKTDGNTRVALSKAKMLARDGLLAPERLCDCARLASLADTVDWRGGSFGGEILKELADVKSPLFWMAVGAKEFWQCLRPVLEAADDLLACRLAHGTVVLSHRLSQLKPSFYEIGTGYDIRLLVFRELDRRVGPDPRRASEQLRRTWMRLVLDLSNQARGAELEQSHGRSHTGADYELGRMRAELRALTDSSSADHFRALLPVIQAGADILVGESGLWEGMRPLLLLLRELRMLAVGPDIRYWSDEWHRPDAPLPWSGLPEEIVSQFHAMAGLEQETDPELSNLRSKFARFCLDRLKSKKGTETPIEPDPRWRGAYVRAARELRVNPEGEGHHTLHRAASSDPDVEVQEAAKEAYVEMRHGPTLPPGMSPRRTVTNALVWLFQAHFLCLAPEGVFMDPRGVQRTREEIARRTSEPRSG